VSVAAVCKRRNRHVSALTESRYKPKVQKQADFGIKPVDKPKTDPLQKWQKIFFEGSSGLTSISAGGMTLTLGYPLVGGWISCELAFTIQYILAGCKYIRRESAMPQTWANPQENSFPLD
jgi:hypothetical protein